MLTARDGYRIMLTFKNFDVHRLSNPSSGNCYDWVEVSYGSYINKYSEKFCGSSNPGLITSTGPTMTVRMHTDYSVTLEFRAEWIASKGIVDNNNHNSI